MKTLGLFGLGAFGQLLVKHLAAHVKILACDPAPEAAARAATLGVRLGSLEETARADLVVIAVPIQQISALVGAIRPFLQPGALVMDVASVKMLPAKILERELPPQVDIVCTHPLFGPQSARNGIAGLKIALCPIRGERHTKLAGFLRDVLRLEVIVTTPEEHDREIAAAMGLTHMIAKVLVEMEPLPRKMTTKSFDLIFEAIEMVRYDSAELFLAIERDNPFSAELRQKFFAKADDLRRFLEAQET